MLRSGWRWRASAALIAMLAALFGAAGTAYAHGFGQRYDLPVPLALYLAGAGGAVALSFVVMGVFLRGTPGLGGYPGADLLRWRAARAVASRWATTPVKAACVGLLGLVVATGLWGTSTPTENLAPTLVWVLWWVGLAYVSALVGNVWALVNPWKAAFEGAEALYRWLDPGQDLSLNLRYPPWLGVWPAVAIFLAFAWMELVYSQSDQPVSIARAAVVYSLVTWGGMLLFGKERWLRSGEAFSLVFGLLARFAPTEVRATDPRVCATCPLWCRDRDGACVNCYECFRRAPAEQRELNLRPFAVGLLRPEPVSGSLMALALLVLATVTFDGFLATPAWANIQNSLYASLPSLGGWRLTAVNTLGLLAFPLVFLAVYLGFVAAMAGTSGRRLAVAEMARIFVFSLIPIALAYHLAHFLSFLVIQGQLIVPLASDPFGYGWDLAGTAGYQVNIGIVDARFAWITAVVAIVLGHISAVYLAHVMALRAFGHRMMAVRSQYPLLVLMVGYTVLSLWILAQPIVETSV